MASPLTLGLAHDGLRLMYGESSLSPAPVPQSSSSDQDMRPPYDEEHHVQVHSTIDLQSIQNWRKACQNTHGACCNGDYMEALAHHLDHLKLVDVISGSLAIIPTSSPITYVALSYVWGDVPMFKTKSSNIQSLLQPGALYDKDSGMVLPDTVRDAMYLVEALGERYLWVDCLSIVQDADVEDIDHTLRGMAHIYASADFTIVAADGNDATHGLRGVGGPSTDRFASLTSYPPLQSAYPFDSKWASRGWTFQESLFSRRLLIVGATVSWMCGRCEWREGVDIMNCTEDVQHLENIQWPAERPHLGVPMGMMSLIPRLASLGRWGMLVEDFSSRELTYEKDTRAAFAGATEIMGDTFPDGLLHGLPTFFFDIALLWLPESYPPRREGEPSWSWTGWKDGDIDCLSAWYPFYATIFCNSDDASDWVPVATLKSVAKYRLANAADGDDVGFNGFYRYQAFRDFPSSRLPAGWERHQHESGDYFTSAISSRKYPFPLPIATSAERRIHSSRGHLLRCIAPCAELAFGRTVTCWETQRTWTALRNGNETVGNLVSMCDMMDLNTSPSNKVCELIALSEAETSLPMDVVKDRWPNVALETASMSYCTRKLLHGENPVAFYNVMWIEWVEDVAERRGLGVVLKDSWDALRPEIKEFNLG